jgi:hypothetical protein
MTVEAGLEWLKTLEVTISFRNYSYLSGVLNAAGLYLRGVTVLQCIQPARFHAPAERDCACSSMDFNFIEIVEFELPLVCTGFSIQTTRVLI